MSLDKPFKCPSRLFGPSSRRSPKVISSFCQSMEWPNPANHFPLRLNKEKLAYEILFFGLGWRSKLPTESKSNSPQQIYYAEWLPGGDEPCCAECLISICRTPNSEPSLCSAHARSRQSRLSPRPPGEKSS